MSVKTSFLFSGQGAQFPGMMRKAYDSVPRARRVFDIADKVLGRKISELCFEATQEELDLTHNTQPCVLAADLAACEVAKASGFEPDAVAGFSVGEYAALVAAGCLDIEDAFRIVQLRADAMQEAVPVGAGAMAAIMRTDAAKVQELCDRVDGYVVPANYNSPAQIVVSGEVRAIDALIASCRVAKIRAVRIAVSAPFHCELMAPAAEKIKVPIAEAALANPSIPVYMNVNAKPLKSADKIMNMMVAQAKSPVLWKQTLENMNGDGFARFVECGPGSTITGFVKKTLPGAEIVSIEY